MLQYICALEEGEEGVRGERWEKKKRRMGGMTQTGKRGGWGFGVVFEGGDIL